MAKSTWGRFTLGVRRRKLFFRKASQRGSLGSKASFEIKTVSYFFHPHFQVIARSVNRELRNVTDKGFDLRAKAISKALQWVAHYFDLKPNLIDGKSTRVMWYARRESKPNKWVPMTEWRILNATHRERPKHETAAAIAELLRENQHSMGKRFRRLEKYSKGLMRDTFVVFQDGVSLIPAKTREEKKHD